MTFFDFDSAGAIKTAQNALSGNSMIKFARTFADKPTAVLGAAAAKYGFPAAGQAISTGRIDTLVSAVGNDAISRLIQRGTQQVNKAINKRFGKLIEAFRALDGRDPPPRGDVLMMLGGFPFMVGTAAHQSLKKTNQYRWAKQDRLFREQALQFMGPGEDSVEMEGYLFAHWTSSSRPIARLRALAADGQPLELIDSFGEIHGLYVIESVNETGTELDRSGQARMIEFRLALSRYGEDDA